MSAVSADDSRAKNNNNDAAKDPAPQLQRIPGLHPPTLSVSPTAAAVRFSRRKMSFPAAAPSSSLYHGRRGFPPSTPGGGGVGFANLGNIAEIPGGGGINDGVGNVGPATTSADAVAFNRRIRRFSNVSDAVSRKLSTTIGWRTISVTDIVDQAKSLCGQYIRARLKRSGMFNRKLGLQRLRSMANLPGGLVVCEVFSQLHAIGLELERMHPKLYSGVAKQVSVTITSEKSVRNVLSSIARELFKADISWCKIVSLYCTAGGLAVDCVRQGHPEYLFGIVDTMGLVVERDISTWMAQQGGWTALLSRYRPPDEDHGVFQMMALSVICLIFLLVGIVFVIRTIGKIAFGFNRAHFRYTSTTVSSDEEPI